MQRKVKDISFQAYKEGKKKMQAPIKAKIILWSEGCNVTLMKKEWECCVCAWRNESSRETFQYLKGKERLGQIF